MKQFEYTFHIEYVDFTECDFERNLIETLNDFGKDRWELIQIEFQKRKENEVMDQYTLYLKREINNENH